jgi:(2S)-methylsuccinyl-CoA dehydrogenase
MADQFAPLPSPDMTAAASVVQQCRAIVDAGIAHLVATGGRADDIVDANQQVAYDLAHAAAAVENARSVIDYGARGEIEGRIACAFVADAAHDVLTRVLGREAEWGIAPGALDPALPYIRIYRSPAFLAALGDDIIAVGGGPRHLDPDFDMVADTFRRFADEQVQVHAEHVHRHNADVPESVINGLAEMGGFGLSVPEEYGGYSTGGEGEYLGMVVATEELSRGSLGISSHVLKSSPEPWFAVAPMHKRRSGSRRSQPPRCLVPLPQPNRTTALTSPASRSPQRSSKTEPRMPSTA